MITAVRQMQMYYYLLKLGVQGTLNCLYFFTSSSAFLSHKIYVSFQPSDRKINVSGTAATPS